MFRGEERVGGATEAEVYAAVVESDATGVLAFYIQLNTPAKMVNGSPIPVRYIRSLSTLADGSRQHAVNTSSPYADLTTAVEDFVLDMVEGDGSA